jgi:hypothetical protein
MTTERITKPSEALKLIRRELQSSMRRYPNVNFFICIYLNHRSIHPACSTRVRKYIHKLLGDDKFTLNSWLREELKTVQVHTHEVNAVRLRWLTWMIRRWQAIGK